LERWQDDQVTHLAGFTCLSLARPAALPRHQTRNTADVLLQVAKELGGSIAKSLPWKEFQDLLYVGARGLYEAGRGYVVSTHGEASLRRVLEREGYWVQEFSKYDAFWDALQERGAWWDPTSLPVGRNALLRTPSQRFEFYSTALKELVDKALKREGKLAPFVSALGGRDRGEMLFLPAVPIPQAQEPGLFPLRLITYRLASRPIGGGRNQPWLLEQPAVHLQASWEGWVEVHPDTAAALGINEEDWVWVESAKGKIRLRAKVYAGTLSDVVHVPLFGGEGPNPNDLIANELDPFRGFGLLNTTRVRLRRA
ncbi:MAG: molybdopterin dinucleotide binding domain-containing protein, partial [Dehalococcoidia bacterium]